MFKKFAKEFKEFALQGNVVDMAIGVIIGAAFKDIVTSFTDNFINPLIASIGGANIAGSIRLPWVDYTGLSLEEVQSLSLNYGAFITAIINFIIMALILFLMLKGINSLKNIGLKKLKKGEKEEEAPAPEPEPSDEVKLLTEIRDALKEKK
ncbi:MAG: large conductance mechanosensitive channel protein MscL [Clostridiales bacterium]|nr:large conductance mechanosensitive channel protein MscL [Clostridiales bacterium]MBQ4217459.1 large conductance mechanosensitive channel protein MscL [Clostridiales bacterium]MBQ5423193.1 large conductance mechanosensitive channel protein MscL [Clostridiales bacterium]